jgi:hypothetical protein
VWSVTFLVFFFVFVRSVDHNVAVLTPSNRLSRGRRSIKPFSKLFSSLEEIELRRRGGCEFAGKGTNGEFSGSLAC